MASFPQANSSSVLFFNLKEPIDYASVKVSWSQHKTHSRLWENQTSIETLLTYLFMKESPSWEANRFSASQEIPRI